MGCPFLYNLSDTNNTIYTLVTRYSYMSYSIQHRTLHRWLLILVVLIGTIACTDERTFTTNPNHRLTFSTDTVAFDTLFTEVSSATYAFRIYNRNPADLRILHATLAGGASSPYRVNVDGMAGTTFSDLTLRKADSMYVFVEVTVDPRGQDTPFEVCDSLCFTLESGITQQVILTASGQDATVLRGTIIDTDTRFTATRPYLIYDSLCITDGATLYLDPGTRIFFADKVEMQIYGRIEAVGTMEYPITLRGARTDRMFSYLPYDRLPAQWGGITLHESSYGNVLVHCDIHSGTYGLRVKGTGSDTQKVAMYNSQIHNVNLDALQLTLSKGLFANSLFSNAGGHCVNILGGQVDFLHCTIANFFPWKGDRGEAVSITNYVADTDSLYPLLGANFINSIITGSKDDELTGTVVAKSDTADWSAYARYVFAHSLVNTKHDTRNPDTLHYVNIVWEHRDSTAYGSSHFRTIDHSNFIYDFHLDSLSTARGIASPDYLDLIATDKDEQPRPITPDAGCYQYLILEE